MEYESNRMEYESNRIAAIFTSFIEYELYQSQCRFILIRILFFVFLSTYRMTASIIAAYLLEDGDNKEGMNL